MENFLQRADIAVLRQLNLSEDSAWHPFFALLSDTTSFLAYGVPLGIIIVAAVLRRRGVLLRGLWSLATVFAADYLALLVKNLVGRRRPYEIYTDILLSTDGGNSSFPSGHSVQAFAMAFAVVFLFRRKGPAVVALCWATAVGLSRLCMGAHYPTDVLGAGLLAAAVAFSASLLERRWNAALLAKSGKQAHRKRHHNRIERE